MALSLKSLLPRSLLGRSLLIIVTPLVLVQLISTYIFYGSHWDTVTRRLASSLAGEIGVVVDALPLVQRAQNRQSLLDIAGHNLELRLEMRDGDILPNLPPPEPTWWSLPLADNALPQALSERVRRPFLMDSSSLEREIVIDIQLPEGVLRVIAPRKRLTSSTTYIFVLWMVGSSMLLFGVAIIFMRNQVRSVRRLAQVADSFGKGRDVPNFRPEGAAEVRQAAAAFNLMRNRIMRQIQQRTEMLAGVSHDLRTPLTRMKLQLAMMGEAEGIAELNEDVAEMEHMVEGYLAFARGEGSEVAAATDLNALLEEVIGGFRREGAAIDLHCETTLVLPLRSHAMRRCLTNLIGNARRYAQAVSVRAGRRGDTVEITIDDDGPGIPFSRRGEVFKPFFRLETSRNIKTGGVGLGLTIARDVVRSHGGEIHLDDSPWGGLRVQVRLPL